MTNHAISNSIQNWANKTVKHHRTYPDLFAGSHLPTAQKTASECYIMERFIGTITQRSHCYVRLDIVGGLVLERTQQRICVSQPEMK